MEKFIRVEYDREYCGGDYEGNGEFVFIPCSLLQAGTDMVERAFEKKTGLSAMRIVHYSPDDEYDAEGNLIEDGKIRSIQAECHSDDRAIEVKFNAFPWFKQASDKEILALAECGWGGDYPADYVAMFMANKNQDVADMFKYVEIRKRVADVGFECHVAEADAKAWIKQNKPELAKDMGID